MNDDEQLRRRATDLRLNGVVAHWPFQIDCRLRLEVAEAV